MPSATPSQQDSTDAFTLAVPGCQPGSDILLSVGRVVEDEPAWRRETLWRGLKLILVHSGRLDCRVEGQDAVEIRGPTLCAVANQGEYCGDHLFSREWPVHYTTVLLDFAAVEGVGLAPERLLQPRTDGGPVLSCLPASRPLLALARQIATCPLQGPARGFYLGGKALELAALGLDHLLGTQPAPRSGEPRLDSADRERLQAARELLCRDLQNTPALAELAREVGLNVRKLTEGFQRQFGTSVHACLQEARLNAAYRLLASGECNVSSAAYRVGYTPAHFSVAFRKRFGLSPKALR